MEKEVSQEVCDLCCCWFVIDSDWERREDGSILCHDCIEKMDKLK